MNVSALREVARGTDYFRLQTVAEDLIRDTTRPGPEKAVARILLAYALLRIDVQMNFGRAFSVGSQGAAVLTGVQGEDADWALMTWCSCYQVAGDHQAAEMAFREILYRPGLSPLHRAVCRGNLATTIMDQGRRDEALGMLLLAATELAKLPQVERTMITDRERDRIRLNLAGLYLEAGDASRAGAELAAIDPDQLSPIMQAGLLIAQARIAIQRDEWDRAEELGRQANTVTTTVGYGPLRVDALGVLVAVAARRGRYREQQRLVREMALIRCCAGKGV